MSSIQYSIINCNHHPGFIHLVTASLYPLIYISLLPSSSAPGYYHSTLHFHKISLKNRLHTEETPSSICLSPLAHFGLPRYTSGKDPPASAGVVRDSGSVPWVWKVPWRRA